MSTFRVISLSIAALLTLGGQAALAEGDATKGEKVYKKCTACHSLEPGKKKVGPSLHGVVGRKAGGSEGYKYSKLNAAAGEAGLVWDEESIVAYLPDPKAFLIKYLTDNGKADQAKGTTKMTFKLKDKDPAKQTQKAKDVVAYIKSKSQ